MRFLILLSTTIVFLCGSYANAISVPVVFCNDILSGFSSEVNSTIHDLAKLRLDLDQRLARGESDALTRVLQNQYFQKEEEFLTALQIDRESWLKRLQFEIESIQRNSLSENLQKAQTRTIEQQMLADLEMKVVPIGELKVGRERHTQSLLSDDRIMIVGGSNGSPLLNEIEVIDPQTGESKVVGKLNSIRMIYQHRQSTLLDGRVFISGGLWRSGEVLNSVEVIDPSTGSSATIGALTEKRFDHSQSVLLDGRVLLAGGRGSFPSTCLTSIEVIDPTNKKIESIGHLINARQGHSESTLKDGRVLVSGGSGKDGKSLDSIEIIDPNTGNSEIIGRLKESRENHIQSLLPDGRILVVGGYKTTDVYSKNVEQNAIELIDPTTGESQIVGYLEEGRYEHGQSVYPDGRVVVVGGKNRKGTLNSIEVIYPNGKSMVVGELEKARSGHTQTLLPNGDLVVIGGWLGPRSYLNSIEIIHVGQK